MNRIKPYGSLWIQPCIPSQEVRLGYDDYRGLTFSNSHGSIGCNRRKDEEGTIPMVGRMAFP